ncbi:1,6-anhydro-N-acetylmuramyl-L-alanine amidase AmpD [Alteromonas sp. ASW11-36]|uniref:1,6-anhydro-N-acetylmuramyl-L-alanine amidase AmpD n=1 Tax=Alteromonas arenosi TaxID=3055817 RepID=A0ABT7STS0_9ALTE|nr:1,6-anhydro-N-acetylmuramyl-L-alanine amidase AmpD [Alteromonas sp. ASW11-36]MDM7859550.1 1,6-anhydro-N-acetylmuramyl-L-alanine amidase AmpD [Alteromonas sp. ASW11-36]
MKIVAGWLQNIRHVPSPHFDQRDSTDISLLVIHNISLPPNKYGGDDVLRFFQGQLDHSEHPFYAEIANLRVSSHLFIRRTGEVIQLVDLNNRAWHAGVSSFQGRTKCNDYSIGIELEGSDYDVFTSDQYAALRSVTQLIMQAYPNISLGRIVGHNDIAPGRKTDPGPYFNWPFYRQLIRGQQ